MTRRTVFFLCCLLGGGWIGWLLHPQFGLPAGIVAGALFWFVLDAFAASRVLHWFKSGQLRGTPMVGGAWGEAAERARRAMIAREQRAEDAERQLEAFVDAIRTSPSGVVMLDPQGRIEWCNQTAATHLGLYLDRDRQQHIVNLVRDPEFAAFYRAGNYAADVTIEAPGSVHGRPRRLSLHVHPYGEGLRLLLSRDVTALEQAEAMRRDFVANVSHEIRTPLTVLAGFVETLQSLDLPKEERTRYLQMMGQQSQRMQSLVQDLLTLSRLEGSPLPGEGAWTAASEFMAQCEQEARAVAAGFGKPLDLRFAPAPAVAISGAAAEWQSAFSNLVTNAVRYTPAGGNIEVRLAEAEGGGWAWTVRDSGAGIAPEHLPRLTERFYRVDRSRSRESGGTGLGLAIVKHVVQRHGGELRVESTVGVGSTFTIAIPPARVRPLPVTQDGNAGPPARGSAEE
jgi:two-component system, OmpR family, phosphate regulon sensor histidine kinase PhoR